MLQNAIDHVVYYTHSRIQVNIIEIQLAGFAYPNLTLYARYLMLWHRQLRLTTMLKIVIGYDLLSKVRGYELISITALGF